MPKISVLIPMYNRKHYIEQCLDSALNQTFKDFDIIIRDDGSSDGSADFVAEKYAAAIAAGKIKLLRNEKNLGEAPTTNRLLREATSKYIMILHSDDLYIPQALEHMHAVVEHFNADVVHASRLLTSPRTDLTDDKNIIPVTLTCWENNPVDQVTVMPDDIESRFKEWVDQGTFGDLPHNIFRREFLAEHDLRLETLVHLKWLLKAKVFVKTPQPFYVYRISPDSKTNMEMSPERITKFIADQIETTRYIDKFFAEEDFFRGNAERQYRVLSKMFFGSSNYRINRNGVYKDGITPELHCAVEEGFKKFFGDDAAFPTFLFHYVHALLAGQRPDVITPPPQR